MKRILCLWGLMSLLSPAHAATDLGKVLEGTSWRWDTYTLSGVTPVYKISTLLTLRFGNGRADWLAGCNGTGGIYSLKSHFLSVPEAAGTEIGCFDEKGAVENAMGAFMRYGVFVKLESKYGSPSKLILNSATSSGVLTLVPTREKR